MHQSNINTFVGQDINFFLDHLSTTMCLTPKGRSVQSTSMLGALSDILHYYFTLYMEFLIILSEPFDGRFVAVYFYI